jgi:anti-sigma B factor antagonist
VVSVLGELDLATSPTLRARLDDLVAGSAGYLELNLAEVEYMDSTGLRVICDAHKALREEGRDLRVSRLRPAVARLFELCAITDLVADRT